jgi:hypothetical protein
MAAPLGKSSFREPPPDLRVQDETPGPRPFSIACAETHDSAVDDHCVVRVDPERLAGCYQGHHAPRKTNLDLSVLNDCVLVGVRPAGLQYLQIIALRVRILKGCRQGCAGNQEPSDPNQMKNLELKIMQFYKMLI